MFRGPKDLRAAQICVAGAARGRRGAARRCAPRPHRHEACKPAITVRGGEVVEDARHAKVERGVSDSDGRLGESAAEEGLAHTGGPTIRRFWRMVTHSPDVSATA